MKRAYYIFYGFLFITLILPFAGCMNSGAVIDKNFDVENQNWTYLNKFRFDVKIDDEKVPYNLYMNLRVTANYKYSNMFVLITEVSPGKQSKVNRYELTLAGKDGEWLGSGSGNLYSYQLPFLTNYKFPEKGIYQFYIEQNMRDNPLREVNQMGLRVSPSNP